MQRLEKTTVAMTKPIPEQHSQSLRPIGDDDTLWRTVLRRDARANGLFVLAVRTTGIYCTPSCAARRPLRANVAFFPTPETAEQAGFRACLRCHPRDPASRDPRHVWIRETCRRLESEPWSGRTLAVLATNAGLSTFHFQRTFKRILGISPRQYAEACRLGRLKAGLRKGENVTSALHDAGYGSASRLYENAARSLGMTPAVYGHGALGARIGFATARCALGRVLVAATEKGICAVRFAETDTVLERELRLEFPRASLAREPARLRSWIDAVVRGAAGAPSIAALPVDIRATAFQWRVFDALRKIPMGQTRSYGQLARALGAPRAARAVGRACATNPVPIVIPCHRVVRDDGDLGGYRFGVARKRALLDVEGARSTRGARTAATPRKRA